MEAKGILDDITADNFCGDLETFAYQFKEPRNAEVAVRVLEQETWVGKANFAWKLWGRTDACDPLVAFDLRKVTDIEHPEEEGCHPRSKCTCEAYWDDLEVKECYSLEVD